MELRVDVITLAVNDLDRALAFYREVLGVPSKGVVGTEFPGSEHEPAGAVAFFELSGNVMLALYPRSELVKDSGVADMAPSSVEFSLGCLVESRAAVDGVLARAKAAGGQLTGPPHDRAWQIYSGYFRDLDGHLWEIIWNKKAKPESEVGLL